MANSKQKTTAGAFQHPVEQKRGVGQNRAFVGGEVNKPSGAPRNPEFEKQLEKLSLEPVKACLAMERVINKFRKLNGTIGVEHFEQINKKLEEYVDIIQGLRKFRLQQQEHAPKNWQTLNSLEREFTNFIFNLGDFIDFIDGYEIIPIDKHQLKEDEKNILWDIQENLNLLRTLTYRENNIVEVPKREKKEAILTKATKLRPETTTARIPSTTDISTIDTTATSITSTDSSAAPAVPDTAPNADTSTSSVSEVPDNTISPDPDSSQTVNINTSASPDTVTDPNKSNPDKYEIHEIETSEIIKFLNTRTNNGQEKVSLEQGDFALAFNLEIKVAQALVEKLVKIGFLDKDTHETKQLSLTEMYKSLEENSVINSENIKVIRIEVSEDPQPTPSINNVVPDEPGFLYLPAQKIDETPSVTTLQPEITPTAQSAAAPTENDPASPEAMAAVNRATTGRIDQLKKLIAENKITAPAVVGAAVFLSVVLMVGAVGDIFKNQNKAQPTAQPTAENTTSTPNQAEKAKEVAPKKIEENKWFKSLEKDNQGRVRNFLLSNDDIEYCSGFFKKVKIQNSNEEISLAPESQRAIYEHINNIPNSLNMSTFGNPFVLKDFLVLKEGETNPQKRNILLENNVIDIALKYKDILVQVLNKGEYQNIFKPGGPTFEKQSIKENYEWIKELLKEKIEE